MLAAVDCAVILIDAARGVEAQTEQLFQVARARGIPLLAFVNKYDRPGMEPLGDARPPERDARALAGAADLARGPAGRLQRRDRPRATGRSTASSA